MKDIFENIFAALVITVVLFVCIDLFGGKTKKSGGIVVEKVFKQEREYVEYNSRSNGNGTSRIEANTIHVPASWTVYARIHSGQVVKVKCEAGIYYDTRIGDDILIYTRYGCMTGLPWFRRAR